MTESPSTQPGWPADTGPLRTLQDIGIIPEGSNRLTWASDSRTLTTNGRTSYKALCKFMNKQALRELAALTLEGWNVNVEASGLKLKVVIALAALTDTGHHTPTHPTRMENHA
ncbi:hypothetical protein [Cryobacterium arcticum]|uniref:Uncharacterized protein n=1 Tax=Cryobacterium arcticum TaxID=670052 RepID=A0A318A1P9_9MICO|nr:hypothetical protein [Cryobacterium arcticum]PXA71868.1 hypothetical protein CTB96_02805 [Cryobacterium arcticum]